MKPTLSENLRKLIVEGKYDVFVVAELMKKFVDWGKRGEEVVEIIPEGSIDEALKKSVFDIYLQDPTTRFFGIMIDADDQLAGRWASVSRLCRNVIPDFPTDLPPEGLIHVASSGLRVGVWIMPDNLNTGMLETFLGQLIPLGGDSLWAFARQCRAEARNHGSTHSDFHLDKADIHTYLAWLDPPGQQLHIAILHKALDARNELGLRFARWFVELFQLESRPTVTPAD